MNTLNAALNELIEAATNLVENGGSVANRSRLKVALAAIPCHAEEVTVSRTLRFTPPSLQVLARAAELAQASNDLYIRTQHIEFALSDIQPTNQPK